MIPLQIGDAIARVLVAAFPTYAMYRDFCPEDFQRPGFCLWSPKATRSPLNIHLDQWNIDCVVEILIETDEYSNMDADVLREIQAQVMSQFGNILEVQESKETKRYPGIRVAADEEGPGSAFVNFNVTYIASSHIDGDEEAMEDLAMNVDVSSK